MLLLWKVYDFDPNGFLNAIQLLGYDQEHIVFPVKVETYDLILQIFLHLNYRIGKIAKVNCQPADFG